MDTLDLFQRLSVSLAIGLVIGLERGWHARLEAEGERAAGFRTHALAGVLGGVWGAIARGGGDIGLVALAVAFATFTGVIAFDRYRETGHDGTFGATTVVAAMLAFALGAFAVVGDVQVAAAGGVVVAALLALKGVLHAWVQRLSWAELRSGLVLLAMTFVMLPLLPNRPIDPWGALNPFSLWLMTIMIAVLSFAGYAAIKIVGARRGVLLTGVGGGLVSSTAVTLNMARIAREHPEERNRLVASALVASATMMARILVVVGVINAALLSQLAGPVGAAGLALALVALFLLKSGGPEGDDDGQIVLRNPFELATVLQFGALLTVISVLAKAVTVYAGDIGVYALAAISGIADVDAITLSMAQLGGAGSLGLEVAARAIAIVVAVNTVSKTVMGWIAGGSEVGWRLAIASGLAILAGALGLLLSPAASAGV